MKTNLTLFDLHKLCKLFTSFYPEFINKWNTSSLSQKRDFIIITSSIPLFYKYKELILDHESIDFFLPWVLNLRNIDLFIELLPFLSIYNICDIYVNWNCIWPEAIYELKRVHHNDITNFENCVNLPSGTWYAVIEYHDKEKKIAFAWQHKIYSYLLSEFDFNYIYDHIPQHDRIDLIDTIIKNKKYVPDREDYSLELKYTINLLLLQNNLTPVYTNFTIWNYCPAYPEIDVIDYLTTLPLTIAPITVIFQGKYIYNKYPNSILNIYDIEREMDYSKDYIMSKYGKNQILTLIESLLFNDVEAIPHSLECYLDELATNKPYLRPKICLYACIYCRMNLIQKLTIKLLNDLPSHQLLLLKEVTDNNIIQLIRNDTELREKLSNIPEFKMQ